MPLFTARGFSGAAQRGFEQGFDSFYRQLMQERMAEIQSELQNKQHKHELDIETGRQAARKAELNTLFEQDKEKTKGTQDFQAGESEKQRSFAKAESVNRLKDEESLLRTKLGLEARQREEIEASPAGERRALAEKTQIETAKIQLEAAKRSLEPLTPAEIKSYKDAGINVEANTPRSVLDSLTRLKESQRTAEYQAKQLELAGKQAESQAKSSEAQIARMKVEALMTVATHFAGRRSDLEKRAEDIARNPRDLISKALAQSLADPAISSDPAARADLVKQIADMSNPKDVAASMAFARKQLAKESSESLNNDALIKTLRPFIGDEIDALIEKESSDALDRATATEVEKPAAPQIELTPQERKQALNDLFKDPKALKAFSGASESDREAAIRGNMKGSNLARFGDVEFRIDPPSSIFGNLSRGDRTRAENTWRLDFVPNIEKFAPKAHLELVRRESNQPYVMRVTPIDVDEAMADPHARRNIIELAWEQNFDRGGFPKLGILGL